MQKDVNQDTDFLYGNGDKNVRNNQSKVEINLT